MGEKLIVYGLPAIWGYASPSPFCLKLEAWLRIAGIDYDARVFRGPPRSKTGKIPYVELPDGTQIADSEQIIDRLAERHDIELPTGDRSDRDAALHCLLRTMEEHSYFVGVYYRWAHQDSSKISARDYFKYLPPIIRSVITKKAQSEMRKNVWRQGIGRLSEEEMVSRVKKDLRAASRLLGSRDYFEDQPGLIDAASYGMWGNLLYAPMTSPFRDELLCFDNLVAHTERMRERYFPEQEATLASWTSRN